jgi:hypothetical protein
MSDTGNDPVLRRAMEELRRLPSADAHAVRRVVEAAALARVTPADEPVVMADPRAGRSIRVWSAIGVAAAAAIVGFVARGAWMPHSPSVQVATIVNAPRASSMQQVKLGEQPMAVPQQFVLENSTAHHISVVGDFNKWNAASMPMTRSADGTWSTLVPLAPGRHVYGYMVDSVFTLDPRAPKVRDPDLGSEGSVIIVGRP